MTRDQLVQLVKVKIGVKIVLDDLYKICDLKPLFGILFEEYIREYDFWGHADLDVLWGDIRKFVTDDILSAQQVISAHKKNVCGHLTLYKNIDIINRLYIQHPAYREILKSKKCEAFDEKSITEVVLKLSKDGRVKYYGDNLGLDDRITRKWYLDRGYSETEINQIRHGDGYWRDGKVFQASSNVEMAYLHFHTNKKEWMFVSDIVLRKIKINKIAVERGGFDIDYGLFTDRYPGVSGRVLQNIMVIAKRILRRCFRRK